jgi:ABC-type enterobactin transport system permease subunit
MRKVMKYSGSDVVRSSLALGAHGGHNGGSPVPAGASTACIGGPYLVWLVRQRA